MSRERKGMLRTQLQDSLREGSKARIRIFSYFREGGYIGTPTHEAPSPPTTLWREVGFNAL